MSKGKIVENLGGGEYRVEISYDNRQDIVSELSVIDDKIETADANRIAAAAEITIIESEIAMLNQQLDYERVQLKYAIDNKLESLIGQYNNSIDAIEKKISGLNQDRIKNVVARDRYYADYDALLTRKQLLRNFPDDPIESIWCADLSENIAVGDEVGLIEIAGDAFWNGRNIRPGYNGNSDYDQSRDKKMLHALHGTDAPWTYLKYLSFQSGIQRWRPSTRHARIIEWEADLVEHDYVDVGLDDVQAHIRYLPAYGRWKKNIINPGNESARNVPIRYMNCNHAAFDVGDDVLVEFQDRSDSETSNTGEEGWAKPLIIGFKSNPKPCKNFLYYMSDPIVRKNDAGDIVADSAPEYDTDRYYRVFDVKKNLSDGVKITDGDNLGLAVNKVCAVPVWVAGITSDGTSKSGHGSYNCYRHDSITVDEWTAHAVAWLVQVPGGTPLYYWAVCVDKNGELWRIPNPNYNPDNVLSQKFINTWPGDGFSDRLPCNQYSQYGDYNPVHAFDLWRMESDNDAMGWNRDDVVLGVCGLNSRVDYINLTQSKNNDSNPSLEYFVSGVSAVNEITENYPGETIPGIMCRVLGVKKFKSFFAYANMIYGRMLKFDNAYIHDAETETLETLDISGHTIVYNPFVGEITYLNHGKIEVIDDDYSAILSRDLTILPPPQIQDCVSLFGYCGFPRYIYLDVGYVSSGFAVNQYWTTGCGGTLFSGYFGGSAYLVEGFQEEGVQVTVDPLDCPQDKIGTGGNVDGDCYNYDEWVADISIPDSISITESGVGEKRTLVFFNGTECSSNTPTETEKTKFFGDYQENFSVDIWPHISQYAYIKHCYNSGGEELSNIIMQAGNDGNISYISDENRDFFFVVSASYDSID